MLCCTTYFNEVLEKIVRHVDIDRRVNDLCGEQSAEKYHNFVYCLSKYLQAQGPIPREDILAHFGFMIFAGNETTAKTISAVLLMLAMHPEIQERCYLEVAAVCSNENQYISAEDVSNLTYLEMVCKETMRLFPVAAMLARVATSDVKLNGN